MHKSLSNHPGLGKSRAKKVFKELTGGQCGGRGRATGVDLWRSDLGVFIALHEALSTTPSPGFIAFI